MHAYPFLRAFRGAGTGAGAGGHPNKPLTWMNLGRMGEEPIKPQISPLRLRICAGDVLPRSGRSALTFRLGFGACVHVCEHVFSSSSQNFICMIDSISVPYLTTVCFQPRV